MISSLEVDNKFFDHKVTRSGDHPPDLSTHKFTSIHKEQFIKHLQTVIEIDPSRNLKELVESYNLNYSTVRDWKTAIDGGLELHDGPGKPKILNEAIKNIIVAEFGKRTAAKNPFNVAEGEKFILQVINANRISNGKPPINPCKDTIKSIKAECGIKDYKADIITDARLEACSDTRNSYSMWIMLKSTIDLRPPQLIWNYDATNLKCEFDAANQSVSILPQGKKETIHAKKRGDSSLDLFVKWVHLACATGSSGPVVLLFSLESMNEDAFEVIEINGLSYSGEVELSGYVCFCHSRAGNLRFFNWFISNVVFKTIAKTKTISGLTNDQAFVYCDGEAVALSQIFTDSLQNAANSLKIHVGKLPASCSGIHQACDVASTFKTVKSRLNSSFKRGSIKSDSTLSNQLSVGLNALLARHSITISSAQMDRFDIAMRAILGTLQCTVTPNRVREGFEKSGQHPLDFDIVMKRCYRTSTPTELENMRVQTQSCVVYFLEHGRLSDDKMTEVGLCAIQESTRQPHDERPMHQQRAVLLTNNNTIQRYQASANAGIVLGSQITNIESMKDRNEAKKSVKRLKSAQAQLAKFKAQEIKRNQPKPPRQPRKRKSEEEKQAEKAEKDKKKKQRLEATLNQIRSNKSTLIRLGVEVPDSEEADE